METWDIKYVYGDIIKEFNSGEYDVLLHGCNCQNTMGKGVAKLIKDNWPQAYEADLKTKKGDPSKLGSYSSADTDKGIIANLYTQDRYGTKGQMDFNYQAFEKVLEKIKKDFSGKKILMPAIGAGLAKGNWIINRTIIERKLRDEDVTIVLLGNPPIQRKKN